MTMDKELSRSRFSKALDTYHESAKVQKKIAHKMIQLIAQHTALEHTFLLEIGCGTGLFSRLLSTSIRYENWILNDLCPQMKQKVGDLLNENQRFLCGDAETEALPKGLDLIASSSTIQWFKDLDAFFKKCHDSLNDEGYLAFVSFGTENMKEIKFLTGTSLHCYSKSQLEEKLRDSGFEIVHSQEEILPLFFEMPLQVLHHLKNTGVTRISNYLWTKGKLQEYTKDYVALFGNEGQVPLTYHPLYIVAKKKPNDSHEN